MNKSIISSIFRKNYINPYSSLYRQFSINQKYNNTFTIENNNKEYPLIQGFHHVNLYTGSATATKDLFINKFNFTLHTFSGPETGNKETLNYFLTNGNAKIMISSPLGNDTHTQRLMNKYLTTHGDGIGDISFLTSDIDRLQSQMKKQNAIITNDLQKYNDYRTITYQAHMSHSNLTHTFIELENLDEELLFHKHELINIGNKGIMDLDHTVLNMRQHEMDKTVEWYKKCFNFQQFWSVDDEDIHTEYSSLKSTVVSNETETIKIPINEPAPGLKESQIQEFINEYNGPGIQHLALRVPNIISYVSEAKKNGLEFLEAPPESYYEEIQGRFKEYNLNFQEDFQKIKELGILVDCDENGYLLQIFTKCIVDRPTLFFEIIQRNNHNGFGAGNFKALFKTIESSQEKRGNLVPYKEPESKFPDVLGLHHYAYKCKDQYETIHFYRDILNLPYVHRIEKDYVPSTGKYEPYAHIFFQLKDGSHIAFFDTYDKKTVKYYCADWINHIAFSVSSLEDLDIAKKRLNEHGIDVIGPTDHDGFITSIYFFDPNNLRIELTYQQASLQTLESHKRDLWN